MQESDLFKEASKLPKFISGDSILRVLTKVWSAYTKFIRSLLSTYKTAVTMEFGKFVPTATGAVFIPNAFFMGLGGFSCAQSWPNQVAEHYLSYSAISIACGYPKQSCILAVKEIVHKAVELAKTKEIRLDFKIGVLLIYKSTFSFTSGPGAAKSSTANDWQNRSKPGSIERSERASPANPNNIGHLNTIKRNHTNPPATEAIPWPYLSAFYEDSAKKLSKRFEFGENLSPSQLLEEHKRQIREKEKKKQIKAHEENSDGQVLARIANEELKHEKHERIMRAKQLQELFVASNNTQLKEHCEVKQQKNLDKKEEKYDFFPFNYGTKLEEYQMQLKEKAKQEMTEKMNNDRKEFNYKNQISENYLTSFPAFMKQDKSVPIRRIDNTHVKVSMGQAQDRYEQELRNIQSIRERQEKVQLVQNELSKSFEDKSKKNVEKAYQDNKAYLLQQIEEKKKQKEIEKLQKKVVERTHLGPEESPERIEFERNKEIQAKKQLKREIIEQMQIKQKEKTEEKFKVMKFDEANAMAHVKDWETDAIKTDIKEKAMKNLNREVWLKQMEMKRLEKNIAE